MIDAYILFYSGFTILKPGNSGEIKFILNISWDMKVNLYDYFEFWWERGVRFLLFMYEFFLWFSTTFCVKDCVVIHSCDMFCTVFEYLSFYIV